MCAHKDSLRAHTHNHAATPQGGPSRRDTDAGTYASISDIARAEKLDRTYVGDVLRLTLLAPWVVEAIVEGR
jgi:hypothetical protein